MVTTGASTWLQGEQEKMILARFVDALLDARDELQEARGEEWSRILRDSVRRQKRRRHADRYALAATC
jgi:hypothetical protein